MNISMWMIAKRLRQTHQLQVHILHGEPQMKAMRMYLGNDSVIEKRYAVLGTAGELLPEVPDLSPDINLEIPNEFAPILEKFFLNQ